MAKTWSGTPPTHCDICNRNLVAIGVFVDGRTAFGPWAMMCDCCHNDNGGRLGVGFGQRYLLVETGGKVWTKVETGGKNMPLTQVKAKKG